MACRFMTCRSVRQGRSAHPYLPATLQAFGGQVLEDEIGGKRYNHDLLGCYRSARAPHDDFGFEQDVLGAIVSITRTDAPQHNLHRFPPHLVC